MLIVAGLAVPLVLSQLLDLLGIKLQDGAVGDYLGGVSSWAIQAITVGLLFAIWRSERNDDRATAFNDGLLRLIELYVAERDRVNQLRPGEQNGYFAYNINQRIGDFESAATREERQDLARQWIDEHYREINVWRLSLFRVPMFVREAQVGDEEKRAAMKLLRVSCDRYEQQVFFLLLHEREESSATAMHFFEHKFFQFAGIKKNPQLMALWEAMQKEME